MTVIGKNDDWQSIYDYQDYRLQDTKVTQLSKLTISKLTRRTRDVPEMTTLLLRKFIYYMVIVFIIAMNNYIITTNYSPDNFDRSKLLQKKFRCIRYYQDVNDYNKHMEKTCVYFKQDHQTWMDEKRVYEQINRAATIAGMLIVAL